MIENIAFYTLLVPLLSAVVISLFTRNHHKLSSIISVAACAISFVGAVALFIAFPGNATFQKIPWIVVGDLQVYIGVMLDDLSKLMLLVVTGVGTAIHIFSMGYMQGDRCYSRFFASLSLFMFSMIGIVLASNLLMMFIFWELVGVSSYLLIGFWYEKASAADACKKAFITNRLGDFGFILGILAVWGLANSLDFDQLKLNLTKEPQLLGGLATAVGLLLFCGAMGKSAQFPLHVWLPDAMEGPTPVSALIHAATMVAAGVYMLCRIFFILAVPGSFALEIIAWIGGITALLAALMAVQQNDIKRILAYSTLSQLGYMVMAVGLGGPIAAMFHLTTHAFFKALLFLGAGSVIYALHHEQDIWKMGGLRRKLPITFWTFFVGTLALCGFPYSSGFYSKDAILAQALHLNITLFVLGVFVVALTTLYMSRLFLVAFMGKARSESVDHAHESPWKMTGPLLALALFAVVGGYSWIGIDHVYAKAFAGVHEEHSILAELMGIAAMLVGGAAAFALSYLNAERDPLPEKIGVWARVMRNKFYFDEFYERVVALTQDLLARFADGFDRWIVGGLMVRGIHGTTELVGRALRLVQTGNLQTYAFLLAIGVAFILYFTLFRAGSGH
ncbi:MAG: NADH-quinone oxidoreductase subunit L [Verrucomicrobiota bacterium]